MMVKGKTTKRGKAVQGILVRWGFLLAILALGGWGAWQLYARAHPPPGAAAMPTEPEECALREAAQNHPQDAEAHRALGLYLVEQRRPYEAMWAFQDALEARPGDTGANRGLARALIVAQLPGRALEVLATEAGAAASGSPRSPVEELEIRRVAAAAYLAMGDALGAVAIVEAAGPALQTSAVALLDLGNAYEALGDDGAAAAAYQRYLRLEPGSVEVELALARVATRRKQWDEAVAAQARARRIVPNSPRLYLQMGLTVQARGGAKAESEAPGGAIWLFRQALQADPAYGPAQLQIGLWLLRRRQPGAAASLLDEAVTRRAGGEATRLQLAAALEAAGQKGAAALQRGRYFEATQQFHRAVGEYQRLAALDPGRRDVPLLLSAAYNQMEMKEQASEVAGHGLAQHPDDPQLLARRATLLLMTDNRTAGAALCRHWMESQPRAAEPYRLLAEMERQALHPAEAARLGEQAIERDPQNADYYLETARALIDQPTSASLGRAAELLRHGIALKPGDAELHLRLGEVLERLGDREGARLEYQRSMDQDHNTRFGVYALSQLCPRLGKGARARFYADNVRVLRDRENAVRTLWRQVYQTPDDADAHARLAQQLLQAGDLRQARYQLEQALERQPGRKKEAQQLATLRRLLAMRE